MSETVCYTYYDAPLGSLLLWSDGEALSGLFMAPHSPGEGWRREDDLPVLALAKKQLAEYFQGERREFELPLTPRGTPFQKRVWEELSRIPYGETVSYGEIARRVGDAKACRAVGLANGRNPISIVVPCHRVIGASGKLTGYGGGLDRKRFLLQFEASVLAHGPGPLVLQPAAAPARAGDRASLTERGEEGQK